MAKYVHPQKLLIRIDGRGSFRYFAKSSHFNKTISSCQIWNLYLSECSEITFTLLYPLLICPKKNIWLLIIFTFSEILSKNKRREKVFRENTGSVYISFKAQPPHRRTDYYLTSWQVDLSVKQNRNMKILDSCYILFLSGRIGFVTPGKKYLYEKIYASVETAMYTTSQNMKLVCIR